MIVWGEKVRIQEDLKRNNLENKKEIALKGGIVSQRSGMSEAPWRLSYVGAFESGGGHISASRRLSPRDSSDCNNIKDLRGNATAKL